MILTQYLLDIIFPPVCLACKRYLKNSNERDRHLCDTCSGKLEYLPGLLCPVCFRRIPAGENPPAGGCHEKSRFALAAPLNFGNPVARELVHILKYEGLKTAADPLVSILADYLSMSIRNSALDIRNFIFVPIPLHPDRERKRGFNQALVIAEKLKWKLENSDPEKWIGVSMEINALRRKIATISQTKKKNREEREENVRDCFGTGRPEVISGKNVFLVDDVFTSGATMREAVRVLKLAGAKKIIAIVAARA